MSIRAAALCWPSNEQRRTSLQARVLAQCWKPFGKAQQICCEQIEITANPESWPNVGPTLIGSSSCRFAGDFLVPSRGL